MRRDFLITISGETRIECGETWSEARANILRFWPRRPSRIYLSVSTAPTAIEKPTMIWAGWMKLNHNNEWVEDHHAHRR